LAEPGKPSQPCSMGAWKYDAAKGTPVVDGLNKTTYAGVCMLKCVGQSLISLGAWKCN